MSGLILALSLAGCQHGVSGSYSVSHLPEWVVTTVRFNDGGHGTAMVSLGDPRSPPELRYAPGLVVFDGERLLKLETAPRMVGESVVHDLGIRDFANGSKLVLPLGDESANVEVVTIQDGKIQVALDGGVAWFDAFTGAREGPQPEGLALTHFGPGKGFELVTRADDVVSLRLPLADEGLPLFKGVSEVVALAWIRPDMATDRALAEADRLYKAVMPVYPVGEAAVADGDLEEWRGARALAVDNAPCVLVGIEDWSGDRDGSFGIAARVSNGRLVLALRVRDDALMFGKDRIEVEMDGQVWSVPMQTAGLMTEQDGLRGGFTEAVDFGMGLELSMPLPPRPDEHTPLPLVVRYIDEDPDETPTTLATAPSMRALAVRTR